MKKTIAFYPGSFDPFTNGHLEVAKKAAKLFDKVIIGIGYNSKKKRSFLASKMQSAIQKVLSREQLDNVSVETYDILTVKEAERLGATYLVRGIRNADDYSYEENIATINDTLSNLETIYLRAGNCGNISSSLVRELKAYGEDYKKYVPEEIYRLIRKPLKVAIVGGIGSGKSTVRDIIYDMGYRALDADRLYNEEVVAEESYLSQLSQIWPEAVKDDKLNRRYLRDVVFSDKSKLEVLNRLSHPLIKRKILDLITEDDSIVFVEVSAIDDNTKDFFDKIVAIVADTPTRISRVKKRNGFSEATIKKIMNSQPTEEELIDIADITVVNSTDNKDDLETAVQALIYELEKEI